jgi:hypothetical protein
VGDWFLYSSGIDSWERVDERNWVFKYSIGLNEPDFTFFEFNLRFLYQIAYNSSVKSVSYYSGGEELVLFGNQTYPESSYQKDQEFESHLNAHYEITRPNWEGAMETYSIPLMGLDYNFEVERKYDMVDILTYQFGTSTYTTPLMDWTNDLTPNTLYEMLYLHLPLWDDFKQGITNSYGENNPFHFEGNLCTYQWEHGNLLYSMDLTSDEDGFLTFANFTQKVNQYQFSWIWTFTEGPKNDNGNTKVINVYPPSYILLLSLFPVIIFIRKNKKQALSRKS